MKNPLADFFGSHSIRIRVISPFRPLQGKQSPISAHPVQGAFHAAEAGWVCTVFFRGEMKRYNSSSEVKLKSILEAVDESILLIDRKGCVEEANNRVAERLGVDRAELIGRCVYDFFSPEVAKERKAAADKALRSGAAVETEDEREGRIYHTIWYPVFDDEGRVIRLAVFAKDITGRKQAEKALLESEARMKALLDSAQDMIFLKDTELRYTHVNAATERRHRRSAEEIIGCTATDLFPPDQAMEIESIDRKVLQGRTERLELVRSFGGSLRIVETIKTPVYGTDGTIAGLCGVSRDNTERKQVEKALRESEKRFRDLYDNAPLGYLEYDPEGFVRSVNRTGLEMLGYAADEMIGHPIWMFIVEGELARAQILSKLAGNLPPGRNIERIYRRKDGSTIPVLNEDRLILDETGRIKGIRCAVQDISDRKRAENEMADLHEQLRHAQKLEAIGTLAGGIAHDFNNILFPIVGFTEMLQEDLPRESPLHLNVREILKATERARDLVKQILTFSRQADRKIRPLRMQIVLNEVVRLIRSTLPASIEIRQDIDPECGMVMADPTQIHQIAMNLVTNAFHAMEESGGILTIRLQDVNIDDPRNGSDIRLEKGGYACLTVEDTGVGMDCSVIEKIFEPYFTTKEKEKGTGLGLSIVHGIVKSYKGEISVKSRLGKGSVFEIYLPRIYHDPESEEGIEHRGLPSGNERVLLVDDEEPIVRLEKQMLDRLGYRTEMRTSAIEALEAFRARPGKYDLVVTDMTMPGLTGDRLAAEMMKIRPKIPVIICTGFSEKISSKKAESMGVKGFLMKPVVRLELAETVRRVLDEK